MTNSLIPQKDIVVVGQQPWDVAIGSNCKNIALEFSKHNRVLYVNAPLDRISSIRDRKTVAVQKRLRVIKGKENGLVQLQANLWNLTPDCLVESVNWLPDNFIFDWINKRNAGKFAASIKKALTTLGFTDYFLFNDNEIIKCFYLKELLQPAKGIYYSRDYILATDYWKKHGERLEPLVIANNDLCVANSTYLADYCRKYNSDAYYVGQGCELEIFQQEIFVTPGELVNLPRPIIGYVGALLNSRLDIAILTHLAAQRPGWSIVLTGPEDEVFTSSPLHQLPNVFFTGPRPATALPGYINAFDVCINPQIVNDLTIGNYPRKVDEYLAMGKPVVATATRAMDIFKEHVYLASGKEAYVSLIEKALEENGELLMQRRRDFAAAHTWQNSVAEIYNAIAMS